MTRKSKNQDYNQIEQLDAIEHIRLRPGMYIGTNENPAHLFSEVIDNALDEAANGYCDRIDITYDNNIVVIQDNGRGIPHTKTNKGQEAIIAATENMSGGKFNRNNYKKSCGLHGVGLCAVRALSDYLNISSIRDGEDYCAKFDDSKLVSFEKNKVNKDSGTLVEFRPCKEYFESELIPTSYIIERGRVAVTEIPKLKIYFNNEELLPFSDEDLLGDSDIKFDIVTGVDKKENELSIRLGYTTVGLHSDESGSVNLLPVNIGTHIDIAKRAIMEAWTLTGYVDDLNLKVEDVLIGSHIYVSASFVETAWTSQDKKQLKMRIKDFDDLIKSLSKNMVKSIQKMPRENRDALLKKFIDYRENQNRLSTAKYMQGVVKYGDEGKTTKRSFSSDSKLVDCVSEDRESTELFVCLHGDTEVKLLDGTVHRIRDLAVTHKNKEFDVYSWNMDLASFISAKAYNPRITGKTDKYIKIGLSDGTYIKCTPNHKFVDKESQRFIRADELKIGQSLSSIHLNDEPDKLCEGSSLVVISLELISLDIEENVYCLTVKNKYHTFMLANGLITKNCEGNSAGSNLISQRDPMIHAVLPLRGKPKNIMEESIETILNNLEMRSIVNSLGTGLMKHERPELCRYGKIIITADADCDGLQISSLVLAALCYLVPKTVLSGKVYLLTAPLYGIFGQNITEIEVEGENPRYYLSSDKLIVNGDEVLSKDIKKNSHCIDKDGNEFLVKSVKKYDKKEFIPLWECYTSPSISLKRYKGLGSMSPDESKIALLSDKRRLQVIIGDSIDKVMKLVGEAEFKKILMKQNDIIDWQC